MSSSFSSMKPSSRYTSFDSQRSSSEISDPKSNNSSSQIKHVIGGRSSSRALIRAAKPSDLASAAKINNNNKEHQNLNLSSMVKKFMDKRSKPKASAQTLFIPSNIIAEDLKKVSSSSKSKGGGSKFSSFPSKLFHKGSSTKANKATALTEVNSNTRTLAMVLRSERELLNHNKEYEADITQLNLMMEAKIREVEQLKDLCLKQRDEIKTLKSAILFPDAMNSQLQSLLDKQGSELQQAKQVIPTLQRQVTSLTGQLQCLADDLAEVKADKYAGRACFEGYVNSPATARFDQEGTDSLNFSSGDQTSPGSPDDFFLKDFNPCLTPYSTKSKSKEFYDYDLPQEEAFFESNTEVWDQNHFQVGKISKSSEYCQKENWEGTAPHAFRWSNENKRNYGKEMQYH